MEPTKKVSMIRARKLWGLVHISEILPAVQKQIEKDYELRLHQSTKNNGRSKDLVQ